VPRSGADVRRRLLAAALEPTTFHHAAHEWLDESARDLDVHPVQAFEDLRRLNRASAPESAVPAPTGTHPTRATADG